MEKMHLQYYGEGLRIDKYLANKIPTLTRTQIQGLISEQLITVNNNVVKANYILKNEDQIQVIIPKPKPSQIEPQNIPLDIYYEDKDIIVVNKPSGMVVHPAAGNFDNTLVNALLYHCKDLSGINGQIRAGIVHRIDKDTSGLLVACKNDFAHKNLSKQFSNKLVKRVYYAICSGVIPHNLGKIEAPIARNPVNRQQMAVIEGGKNAVTNFKVIERFANHTLVELTLETGRTHQIRVHMNYIGYPVTGDPLYGYKKEVSKWGQYLHAKVLGFHHPRTGKYIEFDSPLPDYFQNFLKQIKSSVSS